MAKYRYRIEASNYGGELTIGEVPEAFVDYWMPIVEEDGDGDLIDAVVDFDDWEDEPEDALQDPNAAPRLENYWHEYDDVEHLSGSYADGEWRVYEVPADGSDDQSWDKEVYTGDANHLFGREAYHDADIDRKDQDEPDDYIPVLAFHSSEKGSMGAWFLDTDEPFDHEKLAFGSLETNLCELVERVYYDQEELESNFDWYDSTGKGYYASVGYLNKKWRDPAEQYTPEYLKEEGYFD